MDTPLPDIERAALTLLTGHRRPSHPIVAAYAATLAANPDDQRTLAEFIADGHGLTAAADGGPLTDADLVRAGYVGSAALLDADYGDAIHTADDPEASPDARARQRDWNRLRGRHDYAAIGLAQAVASYRRNGRPAGDQTSPLSRVYALGTTTSSLAAHVVNYHHAVIDGWVAYIEQAAPELL